MTGGDEHGKNTFKQVFRDRWEEFKDRYPRYKLEALRLGMRPRTHLGKKKYHNAGKLNYGQ